MQVPDFWRTEIWHPLTVHFPVVLLPLAALFYVVWLASQKKYSGMLYTFRAMLLLGVAGAWAAIYTGDLADGEVSRKICDPTVLKDHEIFSYTAAIIFSAALAIQALPVLGRFPAVVKKSSQMVTLALLLAGSGFIAYTGHLGATLVYQQGAGVYHPSDDCKEFE